MLSHFSVLMTININRDQTKMVMGGPVTVVEKQQV